MSRQSPRNGAKRYGHCKIKKEDSRKEAYSLSRADPEKRDRQHERQDPDTARADKVSQYTSRELSGKRTEGYVNEGELARKTGRRRNKSGI